MNLEERTRALPREIEPERDLFGDIRRRIENEEAAGVLERRPEADETTGWQKLLGGLTSLFPRPLAAAGVGAALMAASAAAVFFMMPPQIGSLSESEIAEIALHVRERDGVAHVQADVAAILANRGEAIPPEALTAIESSLRDIDRAIAEIHLALLENPTHPSLGYMLAEAYQREAQLLEQLESWTQPVAPLEGGAPTTSRLQATEVLS